MPKDRRPICPHCQGNGVEFSAVDYPMGGFNCFECGPPPRRFRRLSHKAWLRYIKRKEKKNA